MLLPRLLPFAQLALQNSPLECFGPPTQPHIPVYTITVADCFKTTTLLHGDKYRAPMKFSRSAGFRVPHKFSGVSACTIHIDVRDEDDEVTLTLNEVAGIAVGIAGLCDEVPALGGQTWAPDSGATKWKLRIKVYGVPWPPYPPPPGNNGTGAVAVAVAGSDKVVDGEGARLRLGGVSGGNGTVVGTARRWQGGVEEDEKRQGG